MIAISQETCLKEAIVEVAAGTPFDIVKKMVGNTSLPDKAKDEVLGELALNFM